MLKFLIGLVLLAAIGGFVYFKYFSTKPINVSTDPNCQKVTDEYGLEHIKCKEIKDYAQ
jgi:hypothetical protein